MLHVRDCPGLLSNGDVCPFPWCRKTKHLLYHLVSCEKSDDGKECGICCPKNLSSNLSELVGLNKHRRKQFVDRTKAIVAAAKRQQLAAARAKAVAPRAAVQHQYRGPVVRKGPIPAATTYAAPPPSASTVSYATTSRGTPMPSTNNPIIQSPPDAKTSNQF